MSRFKNEIQYYLKIKGKYDTDHEFLHSSTNGVENFQIVKHNEVFDKRGESSNPLLISITNLNYCITFLTLGDKMFIINSWKVFELNFTSNVIHQHQFNEGEYNEDFKHVFYLINYTTYGILITCVVSIYLFIINLTQKVPVKREISNEEPT